MDIEKAVIELCILLILILLSGYFSSAESAFTTANKVKLKTMADDGDKAAARVLRILSHYNKMLGTILVGNNIVNLSATALTTTIAMEMFGNTAVSIVTAILTVVIIIFGEIVPKNWGTSASEKLSLRYSRSIEFLMYVLTPIVIAVNFLARGIMRIMKIPYDQTMDVITEDELRTYVDVGHEGGAIEEGERKMINNVFDFSDAVAKDIMIPRIDMTTISSESDYDQVMEVFRENMFTRLPVYEDDNPDNMIGIINIKDFILVSDSDHFTVRSIMRPAYYTYEYKKTSDLMVELRHRTESVAFVLSEYGGTVGMITMEDLVEEIVGEIRDEFDEDESDLVQQINENKYAVQGSMKLDDVNDILSTEFDSDDYDSVGGLMIERLERIPRDREKITLDDGTMLEDQGVKHNRIQIVLITLPDKTKEEEAQDSDQQSKAPALFRNLISPGGED
ncbi:MAG: hemolysin family protein [Lachnospiraceae bacterium]|nr:hemolysin family protein [Lachnospiraceae bacterium]